MLNVKQPTIPSNTRVKQIFYCFIKLLNKSPKHWQTVAATTISFFYIDHLTTITAHCLYIQSKKSLSLSATDQTTKDPMSSTRSSSPVNGSKYKCLRRLFCCKQIGHKFKPTHSPRGLRAKPLWLNGSRETWLETWIRRWCVEQIVLLCVSGWGWRTNRTTQRPAL